MKLFDLNKVLRVMGVLVAILLLILVGHPVARGAFSNISTTTKWAWNDIVGWIDFYANGNGLNVKPYRIDRWGLIDDSTDGYIATHCASRPPDASNDCSENFGITNASGTLTGYAWSDDYGWISFEGSGTSTYGVTIDGSGYFHGYAWNDIIGWISFNCLEPDICATSNYRVLSTWPVDPGPATTTIYLESTTIDTESNDGFIINSIYWEGSLPAGSIIGFQLGVATSTDFTGVEFVGPDGTASTIYEATDIDGGESIVVYSRYHSPFQSGYRYFRYRVYLDKAGSSPVVSKVVVNWSR
jgi:hypothetical protein